MNPLEQARAAYKEKKDSRFSFPVLGGAVHLVLGEPEGLEGYTPFALQAGGGMTPTIEQEVKFLAASLIAVEDGEEQPIVDEDGEPMTPQEVAAAITGTPVVSNKEAVYAFFSSGEPPKLSQHQLMNAAFMHRTQLAVGMRKAVAEAPEV